MSIPRPPAPRRRIASILAFPIFFAIALPVALAVAFHQPQPHNVPIAVVGHASQGSLVTDELHGVYAGGFAVRRLPSAAAATAAVRDRRVAAAYVDEGPAPTVYVARAAAPIRANYLQGVFAGIAAKPAAILRPSSTWFRWRRVTAVRVFFVVFPLMMTGVVTAIVCCNCRPGR